jgi:RNA polymerase sigma factor (sigma-70 family)
LITNTVIKQWTPLVAKTCRRVCQDEGEIEDMVQTVWLAALESYPRFEESKAKFPTWLGAVARQQALKYMRDMQPESFPAWEESPACMSPEDVALLNEKVDKWYELLEEDEIAQEVLYHLRTYKDVAKERGLSEYQVRYHMTKLKEKIHG